MKYSILIPSDIYPPTALPPEKSLRICMNLMGGPRRGWGPPCG